jgi:hypothetical protein
VIDRGFREIARVGEDLALLDRALAEQAIDDPRLKRLMTINGIDMVSGLESDSNLKPNEQVVA